jgi:hypothetical protein
LEILIEFKADINIPERDGATPLHIAAFANCPKVVQRLVAAKAVVDKEARVGNSPLYTAAQAGNLEAVEALLNSGALVDKARQDGSTPLHMASQRGHEGVVTTLLQRKASVNHLAEPSKATALHVAAGQGHPNLVKLLLAHGANSVLRLACQYDALNLARHQSQQPRQQQQQQPRQQHTKVVTILEDWEKLGPDKQQVVTLYGWKYHEMKDWRPHLHGEFPHLIKIRAAATVAALCSRFGSHTTDAFAGMLTKAMDCIVRQRDFRL